MRPKDWNTIDILRRRSSSSSRLEYFVMSSPSNSTLPEVGRLSRFRQRTTVDFPEPDRPMTTKISPRRIFRFTSQSATVAPVFLYTVSLSEPSRIMRAASARLGP